jgi:hypothetical protein
LHALEYIQPGISVATGEVVVAVAAGALVVLSSEVCDIFVTESSSLPLSLSALVLIDGVVKQLPPLPPQTPHESSFADPPHTLLQSTSNTQLPLQSTVSLVGNLHELGDGIVACASKLHAFVSMHPVHVDLSPPHTPQSSFVTDPPQVPSQSSPAKQLFWQSRPFGAYLQSVLSPDMPFGS